MLIRIRAFEARAAEHHMHVMGTDIIPDSLPKQFDDRFGSERLQHAGAAKLEKAQTLVSPDQWRDIEFGLCVEPSIGIGDLLPEQPVGADQLAIGQEYGLVIGQVRALHDDEVIAE